MWYVLSLVTLARQTDLGPCKVTVGVNGNSDHLQGWLTLSVVLACVLEFGAVAVLPFPEAEGSALSSTMRRPSRLDIGAPRSKGSVSPLCQNTQHFSKLSC